MSENILMSKNAHFCVIICAILTVFMRNSYLLTILEIIDAKFAHLSLFTPSFKTRKTVTNK